MNSFERFRNRNLKRTESQSIIGSNFIFQGYPATEISNTKVVNNQNIVTTIPAAVVNYQEKDKAYIYTRLCDSLEMGSIWEAKTLHWLISEELITIKDVTWHKYGSFLCNINVENVWGYFKGPEKTYVNIKNEQGASLESLQKPVLVLPANILGFSDKIVIKNRPWLVQEWDAISSPGLVYYSLRATTVSKEVAEEHEGEDVYIEHATNNLTPVIIVPEQKTGTTTLEYRINNNIDITVTTEDGYFKFDKAVEIKKHTATSVIFSIPFGIDKVNIQTKEGGVIVTETYVTQ